MYTLNTILLYYLILLETTVFVDSNCAWEHPDTTSINSLNIVNRTWDIFAHEDNTTLHYVINPCTQLTRQQLEGILVTTDLSLCYGSYVCVSENNGAATGTGDSIIYEPEGNHDFLLNITHINADYRTIINFRCDKTMGFPIFVKRTGNISFFEWRTTGACSVEEPVHQEVPCVTYTSDGKLINLDPLVKLHGAYSVDGSTGFFINICRGITTETTIIPSGCEGSAACLDGMSVGNPTMGLHNGASGLVLTYIAEQVNEDCTAADGSTIRPSTNVTLSCPRAAKGGLPTLVSSDVKECHHEVIWETEHACPEEDHISKTCQLYLPRLETNIDLSTLHNSPRGQVIDTSDEYQYIINICGQSIDEPCGSSVTNVSDIAGCQKRNDDSSQAHVIGRVSQQTLRYGDNELFLIYDGGDQCSNGQQRTTVIKLHCATEDGSPTYSTEAEHCMYVFDWDTTQACVNATQNDCSVVEDGTRFDLGALMKTKSDTLNWDVDTNKENSASSILMNVCSALIRTTRVEQCDAEAAVCYIDEQGHAINIGKYRSNPIYRSDQRVIQITYTDGDICTGTNRAQTVLTLQCVPGEQTSEPVLQFESDDHCLYEIHWRTALACDMGRWEGEDCSVELPSGITFNLEPLRNQDFSLYVNSTQHSYALSVCGPVHSSCGDLQNVGSCQTVTDGSVTRYYSTGEANRNLTYTNGMLIMHYKNGSPYSSGELRETDIVFLCDPAAGLGTPQYINENEHTYSFKWYTAYACIEPTVECSAMASDGTRFDLSSLSRSEDSNWNVDGADGTVYHINVCQSLIHTHGTANCHLDSAICSTDRDSSVNLGKSLNRPVALSPNSVSILYTDGDVCGTGHYSTNITFVCQPGSLNEGPTNDVHAVNECEYSVIWPTEAACSIAHNNSGHCTVKDQNSNYMFDFNPLKKDPSNPYTVNSGAVTYKLNICGSVDGECGTDSSVCLGDSPLGKVSENIEYSDVDISITYKSGSIWSILHFSCELSIIDEPLITFDRKEGNKYLFKVQTALACPPSPVDCVVNNNGVQYDLEALGRDQNWHVPAPNGDMYVINICKPINSASANCGGGPIAACKVTDESEANVNLGYVRTRPTAIENAASILYEGGDNCTTASGNIVSISTQVNMYCHEVESMTFEELVNCVYIFHIYSPAVCPIKRTIGDNCMVTDPVYDVTYDLSPLRSNTGLCGADLPDGDHIDFNICRDVGKSGNCASAGACLTQNNQEINIGVNNSHVTYNDNGAISVTYTNHQACGDNDFTTEIILTCDFEQHHTCADAITPVGLKRGDCSYAIIMATSHVCHQRPAPSSIQSTSGERYDLSQLVRTADNYRTIEHSETSGGDATYLINVCTTLVRKEGEMCHPESAACMLKNDRAVNIGSIQEEVLSIDGDNLKLLYTNGDVCSNGEAARTEIILICNKQALASEPHLTGIDSECSYHFVWETVHACKLSDKPVTSSNCTVQNPQTEFVYNLNPLSRTGGYSVLDRDHKYNYTFNVCQPLENSPCNDGHDGRSVGICQKNTENGQHYVAGDSSTTLLYTEDSTITLVYSHGERCHHANRERVTLIHFVCGAPGVGHGAPVFVGEEEEQCMYTIEWHTELACERQIDCTVVDSNNHVFDLSPLIYSSGYHEAESDNDNIYYINVCRPVNPIPEVFCPPQAAVCKVNSEHGNPQNIGEAYHSPILDSSTGLVELRYTTATPCTSNPNAHVSTIIKFTCHRGQEQGVPQLSADSTDCDYVFSWPTYVVCKGEEKVIKSNCSFTDTRTGVNYDLASLAKQDVEVSGYTLRLCGNASACHGAVCQGSRSYGVASTEYIRREGEAVKISYLTTDTCGAGGVYSAHILLQCDDTVNGAGTPKIFYQEDCTVVFTWPTSVVCPPEQCGIRYDNEYYDLSKVNQKWEIRVNDDQSYKFRICHGLDHYNFADGCDLDAAVCLVTHDDTYVLGRADSQHINVQEDKSLIIQYSGGTAMCSGRAAQVTIELTCGQTGGAPKFYKLDEWTCTYMFKWNTDVVCRKNSVLAKSADSPSTGHSGRTAAIVLSVLSVLILATVIYVVLRKPQRREHIFGKVKRAFKRKAGYDSVTYSQLYDDTGTEEDGLFMGVNAASNSGSMLGRMSESPFPDYGNDSSDEDLIL